MGSLCVQSSSKPLLYTQHLASVLLPLDSCCLLFFCSAYSIPWVLISAISLSLAANTCWEFKAASPIETPRVPRSCVISNTPAARPFCSAGFPQRSSLHHAYLWLSPLSLQSPCLLQAAFISQQGWGSLTQPSDVTPCILIPSAPRDHLNPGSSASVLFNGGPFLNTKRHLNGSFGK